MQHKLIDRERAISKLRFSGNKVKVATEQKKLNEKKFFEHQSLQGKLVHQVDFVRVVQLCTFSFGKWVFIHDTPTPGM